MKNVRSSPPRAGRWWRWMLGISEGDLRASRSVVVQPASSFPTAQPVFRKVVARKRRDLGGWARVRIVGVSERPVMPRQPVAALDGRGSDLMRGAGSERSDASEAGPVGLASFCLSIGLEGAGTSKACFASTSPRAVWWLHAPVLVARRRVFREAAGVGTAASSSRRTATCHVVAGLAASATLRGSTPIRGRVSPAVGSCSTGLLTPWVLPRLTRNVNPRGPDGGWVLGVTATGTSVLRSARAPVDTCCLTRRCSCQSTSLRSAACS
jgi:hypothetical protein